MKHQNQDSKQRHLPLHPMTFLSVLALGQTSLGSLEFVGLESNVVSLEVHLSYFYIVDRT